MSNAQSLTVEQLNALSTGRLLNVLKVARKSKDVHLYRYRCGDYEWEDYKRASDYFETVKAIADTREHVDK